MKKQAPPRKQPSKAPTKTIKTALIAPKFLPMHVQSPLWEHVDAKAKVEIGRRRPKKNDIIRTMQIAETLEEEFPGATCALDFNNPLQLLVATILSAQCTDKRVNEVTPRLFKKYKGAADFANASEGELEADIRSTGFFNSKARAIRSMAQSLIDNFGGEVPSEMEQLLTLRGTARKTANVVRMHGFHLPGISVDTHFMRITRRLGLTTASDPEKIEFDTAALLPPERWARFANGIILHGRKTCTARKPRCPSCRIAALCPSAGKVQ